MPVALLLLAITPVRARGCHARLAMWLPGIFLFFAPELQEGRKKSKQTPTPVLRIAEAASV
jgi:hypothetical protein